jgi:predicted nucleotidyltransferase
MEILHIDKDRFIIRQANLDKITGKWKNALIDIVSLYKKIFGSKLISVYVGGSVAIGEAVEGKSDIDTYVVVDEAEGKLAVINDTILKEEREILNKKYPFQTRIETHPYSKDNLGIQRQFKFKTSAVCIFGHNYDSEFPNFALSKETFRKVRINISKDIQRFFEKLEKDSSKKSIESATVWVAKRLIRNAGTLVIWKGDFFTMNVQMMADIFVKEYPQQKEEIQTLLSWTKKPPQDKEPVILFINKFGQWLIAEDKMVFN